jgi:glyoxylase-like metal-dependent hydrolase (beta-lactamase superfamily II)
MSLKRIAKIVLLLLVLFVAAVAGVLAMTFMGRKAISDDAEIGGVRIIQDGIVAVGVVSVDDGEVALIDAGNDPAGHAILEELSRRRLGPDAVTTILLTHGHADHIAAIKAFPRARVMALEAEVPLVEGRVAARGPMLRFLPARPTGLTVDQRLRDGERLTLGPDVSVRVFAIPGHTAGSAAYLINGVLFVGDSADVASDGSLEGAPWIFSDSQAENRAALVRLSQRLAQEGEAVTALVPSHSGDTDGLAALADFALRHR